MLTHLFYMASDSSSCLWNVDLHGFTPQSTLRLPNVLGFPQHLSKVHHEVFSCTTLGYRHHVVAFHNPALCPHTLCLRIICCFYTFWVKLDLHKASSNMTTFITQFMLKTSLLPEVAENPRVFLPPLALPRMEDNSSSTLILSTLQTPSNPLLLPCRIQALDLNIIEYFKDSL